MALIPPCYQQIANVLTLDAHDAVQFTPNQKPTSVSDTRLPLHIHTHGYCKPSSGDLITSSVIIKDLVCVLQYRLHHLGLEPRISQVRIGAHERRPKDDGQVLRAHAVDARVLDDTVEVQCQRPQGCVVGVGEAVDDGVEGVAAENFVLVFYNGHISK